MFRKRSDTTPLAAQPVTTERVTSVLGTGIVWKGKLSGSGGLRIEGTFEGDINLRGLLVVGETGRVTCESLQANAVIVAGALRGNITAERVEIRSTGRVWGDVVTAAFSTEEGAFLRGKITMEEKVELGQLPPVDSVSQVAGTSAEEGVSEVPLTNTGGGGSPS
jgi:cytoskeletal protein CcmA (bactofilin family)